MHRQFRILLAGVAILASAIVPAVGQAALSTVDVYPSTTTGLGFIDKTYEYNGTLKYVVRTNVDPQWGNTYPWVSGNYYSEEFRGYLWFDTNGLIPAGQVVKKVEFVYKHQISWSDGNAPTQWGFSVYMHGALYNGLQDNDWGNAAMMPAASYMFSAGPADVVLDLGTLGKNGFHNDSYGTGVMLKDYSLVSGATKWGAMCTALPAAHYNTRLRITYGLPGDPLSTPIDLAPRTTWGEIKALKSR